MAEIRNIAAEDAAGICRVCSEDLGYPCSLSLVTEKINKLDRSREAVFVALCGDEIVGFIHIEKYDVLYFETMANILGLAVSSEHRKKGIGKALVTAAESWALENGIRLMRLNSGITRTGAHEFYKRLGYGSEKQQMRFVKELKKSYEDHT